MDVVRYPLQIYKIYGGGRLKTLSFVIGANYDGRDTLSSLARKTRPSILRRNLDANAPGASE